MEIKEYKLFKTIKKTAQENNLVIANYATNNLLDLTLLDTADIEPDHKRAIIENIQKFHIFHDRQEIFIVLYNEFTHYEVRAIFANHNVYNSKTWKKLYTISQMTNVKITQIEYKTIWKNNPEITEHIYKTYYGEPVNDIEI